MSAKLSEKIDRLVILGERLRLSDDLSGFVKLRQEIIRSLLKEPGSMVLIPDPNRRNRAIKAVNQLWADADFEELFEEIRCGDRGGNLAYTFAVSAKKLRPTFVRVQPTPELECYYNEAITAWLYGLDRASLILCRATLELLVKERLTTSRGLETFKNDKNLEELIDTARNENVIDRATAIMAHRIRKLANRAVHKSSEISQDEYSDAVHDMKSIIETILSQPARL